MRMTRVLFGAALICAAPAAAELNLQRADISRLPNGLTVIMLEDHSFPVVSVQALYKSGSATEVAGKTGLAHFLEHLAFRASEHFPQARATELIYDSGGEWHGYTAFDQTTYFATMPKAGLDLLLKIEADRMARVVIDPASIEAERGAVITELHSYENDPASVLQEAVARTAIQVHPYGSPMAGYVDDVARLTAEDARAYYASHYAAGNAVLAIVGDFDPQHAKAQIAAAFANVPARPIVSPHATPEPPQKGQRRTLLKGAVKRQLFQLAYPAPAASSPDFPAFLVMQQRVARGSGLNMHQGHWSATEAVSGALLFGAADDLATWLPATRDPFLFLVSGTIGPNADRNALEQAIGQRITVLRDGAAAEAELAQAKDAVLRQLADDLHTTEDAAHQLAFFEGIGALDQLLNMDALVRGVTAADVQRVARTYLAEDKQTVGWMVPGTFSEKQLGEGRPRAAADRRGSAPTTGPVHQPVLRTLPSGLPAIVQFSPLSDDVTVALLVSAPTASGMAPRDFAGLDTVVRSGRRNDLADRIRQSLVAAREGRAKSEAPSEDPETRLEQLMLARIQPNSTGRPQPLAVIVTGNLATDEAFRTIERELGSTPRGELPAKPSHAASADPDIFREHISKPLSQGGIGYVVEGPSLASRDALAWRMLLYILTHDYSGRLGLSAIGEKGLVYHIYSAVRTDGSRTWATLWTGVDADKVDAVESEIRLQLSKLVSNPPSRAEVEAARHHLLGRDITAAQSNEELAAKLAREFLATGGPRSHEQLGTALQTITPADLARLARVFSGGTILRVDVPPLAK